MGLQWNTDSNFTSDVLELNYLPEIHENHGIIVCAHSYFWGNSSLTYDFWSFTMIPMVLPLDFFIYKIFALITIMQGYTNSG